MWPNARLTKLFGIEHPIVLAPMAGAMDFELVAAVSAAGGLGSLPCAMLTPDALRDQLAKVRARTDRPVNVNFFCHTPPVPNYAREARWRDQLKPYYEELGIDPALPVPSSNRMPFDAAFCAVVEELKAQVVSFHFGLPEASLVRRVKAAGCVLISSVRSARFDEVVPPLAAAGCRVIVPYLRGYGATRFLSAATARSGQQGAIGSDLLELLDALELPSAALVGFDWGARAACIVAALWPQRVRCLVSSNGYAIQNIAASVMPAPPARENRLWYQYYFHTERGRAGLAANRGEFCKLLWRLGSPNWHFDDATYQRTAASFDNPDFVDIVIHSYRHRFGYAPGDPAYENIEQQLVAQPKIPVPTIVLHGEGDGVTGPEGSANDARFFTGPYQRRLIPIVGHDTPQEAPAAVTAAVLELIRS